MNSNEDRGGTQYFRIVNQPENSVASVLADVEAADGRTGARRLIVRQQLVDEGD